MNERIREISEAADFYVGNEHYDKSREEQSRLLMQRFAELIINECLVQVRDEVQYISDWDKADKVVGAVKKHFGVEE